MKYSMLAMALIGVSASGAAAQNHDEHMVRQAVEAFHAALSNGDSTAALALLADDATILESGGVETRAEYRSGHLVADIRASSSRAERERSPISVMVDGDMAWTTSTSTSSREVEGRTVRSSMAELMVLSRRDNGWVIRAIHWSSRRR